MNEFSVKTPDEWKEKLYRKTAETKTFRIRPAVILAAVIAFVICVSGSAFAVRVSRAPEYFGSKYLGQSESSDQVYSEKNLVLQSDREDLELVCKGIVGDDYNLSMLFELKSLGDITFSEDKQYLFENVNQYIAFFSSFGKGVSYKVADEKTLAIHISFSGIGGARMVGRAMKLNFYNLVEHEINSFNKTQTFNCTFSGKINVDYQSTNKKLYKTENTVNMHGVTMKPVKAEISNLNFSYMLKVQDGIELFEAISDTDIIVGTLTLNYKDGSKETFNVNMPPKTIEDLGANTLDKRNGKLSVQLGFSHTVNANEVASVELNGIEVFVEK